MVEDTSLANFMRKPITLTRSTQRHVKRLWEIGVDISRFNASVSRMFSSIFTTLAGAITRLSRMGSAMGELSLTRLATLPSFSLWSRSARTEEVQTPIPLGRVGASVLFRVSVARKIATDLSRKIALKAPVPALSPVPLPLAGMELQGEEVTGTGVTAPAEEPIQPVSRTVTDLRRRLESHLTRPITGITSVAKGPTRRISALAPALAAAAFMTPVLGARQPSAEPSSILGEGGPLGKEGPSAQPGEEEVQAEAPPSRKAPLLAAAALAVPLARLRPGAAAQMKDIARISPPAPEPLDVSRPEATAPSGVPSHEAGMLEEGGPRPSEGLKRVETAAFAPSIAVSEIESFIGRELLPAISAVSGRSLQVSRPTAVYAEPAEPSQPRPMLPVMTAASGIVAIESLIREGMDRGLISLTSEATLAQSSYAGALGQFAVSGPPRISALGELAVPSTPPPVPERESPRISPVRAPAPRLRPVTPTIQKDINITVSGEAPEEDLRDLERKISRIMEEQVRRYYGYVRFEEV